MRRAGSGSPVGRVSRSLAGQEIHRQASLALAGRTAQGKLVSAADRALRAWLTGKTPARLGLSAEARPSGLFMNKSACGAVVVDARCPIPTRCSGQSNSIIEGMSWLRLMKK